MRCLEVDRRDVLGSFEQVVATLEVRLVVVGGEDFGFAQRGVVGDQREAAVGDRVVADLLGLDDGGDGEDCLLGASVAGVGAGSTALLLPVVEPGTMEDVPFYPCPCCGYRTLPALDAYDLCPVCFWEDDGMHSEDSASLDGPNGMTLTEGQRLFLRYGSSALHCLGHVRAPRPGEERALDWTPVPRPADEDERQYFLSDTGQLLMALVREARDQALESQSAADIARFEGVRAALTILVEQANHFGLPLDEVGIESSLDLNRDLLLDPDPTRFVG